MARSLVLFAALLLAVRALPAPEPDAPPKEVTNAVGMALRRIPAGGKVTTAFYLGVHEVTQGQYKKVTGKNPSWFRPGGGGKARVRGLDTATFPVEMVSWGDAVAFCRRLSELPEEKKAGRSYRLPTEAEWEHACRAGTATEFSCGDQLSSDEANFHGYYPYGGAEKSTYLGRTSRVGAYAANAWGLFDMHGNVWEWCADWLDAGRQRRVIRGGSWYGGGRLCRSGHRAGADPTERYYNIGFRVAAEVVRQSRDEPRTK